MMKPDIKAKWLEALRSGEYEQCIEQLHIGTGFCCLGVLCDLVKDEVNAYWDAETHADGSEYYYYVFENDHPCAETTLPDYVMKHVGLKSDNPDVFVPGTGTCSVAALNDEGYNFERIADFIEEQL